MMANISVRGLDDLAIDKLRREAKKSGVSMNRYALDLLKQGLGFSQQKRHETWADLDHLAGTWTEEDADQFAQVTGQFREIDDELWK
ncbi:MAG: antitoxin [Oceanicoccus sp.]|uniref:FitA-like ribbon-helix-helix domain-containing protein n=1 Tax=Oceanicoccus sp. TaxID=2691044 RepID=UPI00260F4EBA|nr:hypothetical protein [Oceanicoccus sp.]MCP3906963.1 antitoxin [Oceanicoccus sp.]